MPSLNEYRSERVRKLDELKRLGINPYPAQAKRTHQLSKISDDFVSLEGHDVSVVGRVVNIRKFGKLAFIVLQDSSGQLQLFLREGEMAETSSDSGILGIELLPLLDTGDFLEAYGEVIKTKTGEVSINVRKLRLLTKALRPMPNTANGFTNKEERLRRRYIDLFANRNVYERFLRRSTFWQATRDFLLAESFTEINIPVLELTTGGADANPFVTHMDALDQDFYLRISHELPLKRLLVGGYEKVFDIGPRFRNENYSDEHLPEHMAMEWYWAFADWQDGMGLTQKLVTHVVDKTWGKRNFLLKDGFEIDIGDPSRPWPRISMVELFKEHYQLDILECSLEEVKTLLAKNNLEVEKKENRSRGIDKLWKHIRTEIDGPVFLIDIPKFLQPLAKTQGAKPQLTEQFNLLLGGTELCKAYSELNDPIDQLDRFKEQQAMRESGDVEAMMLDIDFVEALEYGMPPACGFGYSERLFWTLEGVSAREGVIFPHNRPEVSDVTRSIYPDLRL